MKTENALSETQIAEWKKQYGKLYKTVVGDNVIIWRKLKRKDYVRAMTEIDGPESPTKIYDRQDFVVKLTTLYPDNIEELIDEFGTLSTTLSDQIMLKSGFDIASTVEL